MYWPVTFTVNNQGHGQMRTGYGDVSDPIRMFHVPSTWTWQMCVDALERFCDENHVHPGLADKKSKVKFQAFLDVYERIDD